MTAPNPNFKQKLEKFYTQFNTSYIFKNYQNFKKFENFNLKI